MLKTKNQLPLWAVNLKKVRLERGESQADMARRFGVTASAVSQWERAETNPHTRVLAWLMYASGTLAPDGSGRGDWHYEKDIDWTEKDPKKMSLR